MAQIVFFGTGTLCCGVNKLYLPTYFPFALLDHIYKLKVKDTYIYSPAIKGMTNDLSKEIKIRKAVSLSLWHYFFLTAMSFVLLC